MTRSFSSIHWIGLFALAAFALYLVKYQVQDIKNDVDALQAELALEQEALALLGAEWAYLNRPERLRKLSKKYLKLEPYSTGKVTSIDALPMQVSQVAGR